MTVERRPIMLSVIIPCYNEEKNIEGGALEQVYRYLSKQDYRWEVIVVNDGSTDRSRELVSRFVADRDNMSLIDIPHGGKPAGLWAGIQHARGKYLLFTDMDQSTPIGELAKLLPWCAKGYEVVIGSRGTARDGFSSLRKVGSAVFRNLRRLFLLRDISDTQCGFKLCRRDVALEIFPHLQFMRRDRPSGWKVSAYDVEFLYLCERAGYRVKEVVVEWRNRDRSETKGRQGELARYMRESVEMAQEVARVNFNRLRGAYSDVGDARRPERGA